MTPAERAAFEQKMADRQAVQARMQDGTITLTDADAKFMSADEIHQCINLGRFGSVIGRDKRLMRR
jgi:hypothetical protein